MRGKVILITGITSTLVLFGVMIYLMTTVNPQKVVSKTTDIEPTEVEGQSDLRELRGELYGDTYLAPRIRNTTLKRVVPPVWPSSPKCQLFVNEANRNIQDKISNVTEVPNKSLTPTPSKNDTEEDTLIWKRSVSDDDRESDLNSIILKILDASGKFNIEIKIGSKDTISEEKVNTTEHRNHSDTPKYSMSLKTKNNNQFKIIKLAKNIVISVMPNDSVTVNSSDDHVVTETEVKNNLTQGNIVDFDNIIKHDIAHNKSTALSCKDVYKPAVIFYNQTKLIYNSDTKAKDIGKGGFLKELNNTSDLKQPKTNLNSRKTANNTDYNVMAEKNIFENETVRFENTSKINNSTVSTKVFQHKASPTEKVNLEIALANGSSSQNEPIDFIKIEEFGQNQQLQFKKNMGR